MASASTSYGFGKECSPFDVFISVGSDVKKGLATHLYQRLTRLGLRVFLDREELQAGDNLTPQIEGAIKTASVHIAIFSPLYAESTCCLNELVQMLESGTPIIPVFYKVNPSDLRRTTGGDGVYARSLFDLERKRAFDSYTLEKWREALSSAADISGLELRACHSDEALLLEDVVKQVLRNVRKPLYVAKYPTGLDEKVEEFERTVLSQQQSEKTTVVGIVGIGGCGKTTLAKELFNRHRSKYDRCCFLADVREVAARGYLNVLQSRLLKDLAQLDVHISSTNEGVESLKMHLPSSQRVLVVIDDVDNLSQLDALVSPIQHTVHSSSLILVTSRDKGLLTSSGIKESLIYEQTGLDSEHSLKLFCSHAFHQRYPAPGFERLVEMFLNVCDGLPLFLKVIGELLYGKDLEHWEMQLLKMSEMHILRKLEISYDSLNNEEKQIFLDTACFFIGEDRDTAIRIWDGSHWQGRPGLKNLENKGLLEVDSENCIRMHDLLWDLGRDIAEKVTPHRLWRSDDILPDNSSVRGISMVHETDPEESFEIPTNIRGLQLLRAHGNTVERILGNARSPQLVWLSWYSCPFSSLPSWISVENLRVLHIQGEILKTLWQHESEAPLQLRELDIDANILNVPKSIGNLKHLEKFVLRRRKYFGFDTVDLETLPDEVHGMHSLKHLELVGCKNMRFLPDSAGNWTSLERIDLGGCSFLEELPESAGNWRSLQRIDLGGCSSLRGLPESAGNWTSLQQIDLGGCSSLRWLPESAGNWTSLEWIDLSGCSALQGLPLKYLVGQWKSLHYIDLTGSALHRPPKSKWNWTNLEHSPRASSAFAASNYVYDVFINCHGPDVKRTFANHLYHRLVGYGLRPFIHEERHEADNIATQIKEAIATASVHVAIFSLRYAESRRCLDELLLMSASGAPVIPVFYNVKRFDLQCKLDKDGVYAGVYGRALQNHEKGTTYDSQTSAEKPRDKSNTIDEWRKALHGISVPEISGFELEAFKYDEAELLDAVVKSVLEKVRKAPFYEVKYLKGLDQKVEDFENTVLLHRQNRKPQVVGIVGVAGVGKTTLAKELINRKSSSFNRACFLFDVAGSSLPFLQSKLLKDLTNMNIQIENVPQGIELFTKHFSSSYGASAFVILDNVDDVAQLKALLPVRHFLSSKSLILITSQSKDVLIRSGVEQSLIYNLTDPPLDKHASYLDRKVKKLTNTILKLQQSEEHQVLGIVGISGIGKTRLAMEFFNRKSSDYTRSYFFYDVNETARTSSILHNLQSKLLQGLTQLDLQVQGVDESIDLFKEHVSYFRSLVILDNVDHWDQLHALLSVLNVLPSGSLILVTCREVDVLKRSGVQESSIYKLNRLNPEDSLDLFCTDAFGQTVTPQKFEEFKDLVAEFVRACNGVPLTLKMFRALLWGKTNRSYWKEQLDKLHQIHPDQIERRLKLCYDELNEEEQKIFLHIACSCVGTKRDLAVRLWDASGSKGLSVFESLQKRCLVDVNSEDCIIMHEHLRELGRFVTATI